MTRFTAFAAALLMTAGAASAQVTTQAQVGGPSGVAGYPTTVLGANGVTYACADPETVDGVIARRCVVQGSAVGFEPVGAGAIGAVVAGVVAIALIVSNDDDTNGTNGTNGTN